MLPVSTIQKSSTHTVRTVTVVTPGTCSVGGCRAEAFEAPGDAVGLTVECFREGGA